VRHKISTSPIPEGGEKKEKQREERGDKVEKLSEWINISLRSLQKRSPHAPRHPYRRGGLSKARRAGDSNQINELIKNDYL
jgi:hypothetical protein